MRRLILILTGIALTYSCGGGGGLGDADVHYRSSIDLAKPAATYLTAENHPAWGEDGKDCISCHPVKKHSAATANLSVEEYQKLISDALEKVDNPINVCSACHGLNGVSPRDGKIQRQCLVCHDEFEKIHFYNGTSSRSHLHDVNGDGKFDDSDCVVCHWQPDMDGIVELDTDFIKGINSINELCLPCHSNVWTTMDKTLADTDGDGEADTEISTNSTPKNVETSWGTTNSHGKDSSSNSLLKFKNATLDNQPLFHTDHDALVCSQCHNPHASNNAKLIIEKVGETLVVEQIVKQVDNTEESKYAVVDPQTTEYFDDLKFAGIVKGNYTNYDLSNETSLKSYINLHVSYIDNGTVETVREQQASLCAACHEGTNYYSSVNGLGLAINMNLHNKDSRCSSCHKHDGNVF